MTQTGYQSSLAETGAVLLIGLSPAISLLGGNRHESVLLSCLLIGIAGLIFIYRKTITLQTPAALAAAGLTALSLITLPYSVNRSGAIETLLLMGTSLLFVMIVQTLSNTGRRRLLQIVYLFTVITALLTLISVVLGFPSSWYFKDLGSGLFRAAGPLLYPNALAALIGAVWLSGPAVINIRTASGASDVLFSLAQSALAAVLLLTFSRGAWLAVLFALIWLVIRTGLRHALRQYLPSLAAGVFIALIFARADWFWIISVILLLTAYHRLRRSRLFFVILLLAAASAAVLIYWPEMAARLDIFQSAAFAKDYRAIYYQTAVHAIAAQPLGWGGQSWIDIYPRFQPIPFYSTAVHSGYLEYTLNFGIAFLLLLALLIGWLIRSVKKYRSILVADEALAAAMLVLALHAMIDFDWSFFVLWLLLLLYLSAAFMIASGPRTVEKPETAGSRTAIILPVLVLFCAGWLLFAALLASQSENSAPPKKTELLKTASTLYPFRAETHLQLASAYLENCTAASAEKCTVLAEQALKEAVSQRPNSPLVLAEAGQGFWQMNRPETAWQYYHRAAIAAPKRESYEWNAAACAYQAGIQALQQNRLRQALPWFHRAAITPASPNPGPARRMLAAQSLVLAGEKENARGLLIPLLNAPEWHDQASLWLNQLNTSEAPTTPPPPH